MYVNNLKWLSPIKFCKEIISFAIKLSVDDNEINKKQTIFIAIEFLDFQSIFSLKSFDKLLDNSIIDIAKVYFFY